MAGLADLVGRTNDGSGQEGAAVVPGGVVRSAPTAAAPGLLGVAPPPSGRAAPWPTGAGRGCCAESAAAGRSGEGGANGGLAGSEEDPVAAAGFAVAAFVPADRAPITATLPRRSDQERYFPSSSLAIEENPCREAKVANSSSVVTPVLS